MTAVKDTFKIEGKIKAETDKAILIQTKNPDFEDVVGESEFLNLWFPLSGTHEIHRGNWAVEGSGHDYIVVDKWLAQKRNLV